jgi:ABC-type multidrug transport system permease subunit
MVLSPQFDPRITTVFKSTVLLHRFFTLWATLVCTQLYSSSLYRFVGSSVRAIVAGTSVAVIIMLITFIGTGYVLLRTQIEPWWIWMFWVSPLQYVMTGLANNEFLGKSYQDAGAMGLDLAPNGIGKLFMDTYEFNQGNKWRCVSIQAYCDAPNNF